MNLDLFSANRDRQRQEKAPLAARMRPRTLDELIGHEAVIGPGTLLRRTIEQDRLYLDHSLGTAGFGENDACPSHRRGHESALHRDQRRHLGSRRSARVDS